MDYLQRYYDLKQKALDLLGGLCVECGTTENLEFDHKDPATKSFNITTKITNDWDAVLLELAKCELRCKTCHKIRSDQQQAVGHGEGKKGKRGCKCDLCRAKAAEYMRAYKVRNK